MKNRRNSIVLIILMLAIIGMTVIACGSSTTSPLVGKWHHSEGFSYIEFFSNGKFEIGSDMDTMTGNYEVTGDNQVTLTPDSQYAEADDEYEPITLEYRFSGDDLILSDGETPITFRRAD